MCGFKDIDFEAVTLGYLSLSENHFFCSCNFKNARGADLSDLAGNTLQQVILPNSEVADRQIFDSFY